KSTREVDQPLKAEQRIEEGRLEGDRRLPEIPAQIPVAPPALPNVPPGQYSAGGPFLIQSMNRVTEMAATAKDIEGYGYNNGISILAAWVSHGANVTFTYRLAANIDYLFLAAGDDDARIIDLEVFDN